ncbi:unnamed protein product [Spirodela intermedia]|uniref:Uncharacterized protein n=1 Tax=Spirodela intermedia TaxID=51605 RepID=A0A7I8KEE7_SPIIN|nr:unnamed protein product [Spirodela intermedia]
MLVGMAATALTPANSAFETSFSTYLGGPWSAAAEEDDEVDVFGAEKYFSGAVDVAEHGSMGKTRWNSSPGKEVARKNVDAQIPWSPPPPPPPPPPGRRRFLPVLCCCSWLGESCVEIGGRAPERAEPDGGDGFNTKRMHSFLSSASKQGHAEAPTGGEEFEDGSNAGGVGILAWS